MRAIVGLGNPGPKYLHTRHNVGFMVLDELARRHSLSFRETDQYRYTRGSIGGTSVLLLEPLTFMNLSGRAVRQAMRKFGFDPEDVIVVTDEMDIDTGRVKIKKGGSSGGHNGVQSIIDDIGYKDFPRIKVGIGRDPRIPGEKYVLSKFRSGEAESLEDALTIAAHMVESILDDGLARAMNQFNKKPGKSANAKPENNEKI